jgi:ribonuclease BN (tRNA processing enzyme)
LKLTFVGSGDAFGTGGRFNTCFHVASDTGNFLIDCGASSLVALKQRRIDRNAIGLILISHLHGDHFGGLPFFLLDAQLVAARTNPLTIAGPPGLKSRLAMAMEALFAGSSKIPWKFDLQIVDIPLATPTELNCLNILTHEVVHPSGAPSTALRIEVDGKTIAYSGDTQWTAALLPIANGADLFICECYMFERVVKFHMSYSIIIEHLDELAAKQIVLTHMGEDMMANRDKVDLSRVGLAEDGLEILF